MKFIWHQYVRRDIINGYRFLKIEPCRSFPTVNSITEYNSIYKGLLISEVEDG